MYPYLTFLNEESWWSCFRNMLTVVNTQQAELVPCQSPSSQSIRLLSLLSLSATGKQRGSCHGGMPFADLIPEHLRPYQ